MPPSPSKLPAPDPAVQAAGRTGIYPADAAAQGRSISGIYPADPAVQAADRRASGMASPRATPRRARR